MLEQRTLVEYLDNLLNPGSFKDYCPNGLQVAGDGRSIQRICTATTSSLQAIKAAIALKAEVLLVHHGLFWRGDLPNVVGNKRERLAAVLGSGLSVIAYHLPLDAHPLLGNHVQLARHLGWAVSEFWNSADFQSAIAVLRFPEPLSVVQIADMLSDRLQRVPVCLAAHKTIQSLAICTGAAHKYTEWVAQQGVEAYLTGELSESTYHIAKEYGITVFGAGHHATERYGVQALGENLAEEFGIAHTYIEIDNPI